MPESAANISWAACHPVLRSNCLTSQMRKPGLTANVGVSSKHAETILTVCFQLRKLRCISRDRVCAREHTPVSRFKWHTLKLLKPDEKLHPKLFSTSILLMRGGIENRTSRLVEKEKWKLKSCLCLRLNEVLRGNTQLTKHFCNVGEESGPVFSQGCLTWGGRQNAAERECDSQQPDPVLPLTLHINMLLQPHIRTWCWKMWRSLLWLTRYCISKGLKVKANRGRQTRKAGHKNRCVQTVAVYTLPSSYINFLSVSSYCQLDTTKSHREEGDSAEGLSRSDWPMFIWGTVSMAGWCGWCNPWAGGPGLYRKVTEH